jgi:hypothetical protein
LAASDLTTGLPPDPGEARFVFVFVFVFCGDELGFLLPLALGCNETSLFKKKICDLSPFTIARSYSMKENIFATNMNKFDWINRRD